MATYTLFDRPSQFDHLIGVKDLMPYLEIIDRCEMHVIHVTAMDKVDTHYVGNKEADICLRFEWGRHNHNPSLTLTNVFHYPDGYTKSAEEIENDLIWHRAHLKCLTKRINDSKGMTKDQDERYSLPKEEVDQFPIDAYIELISQGKIN